MSKQEPEIDKGWTRYLGKDWRRLLGQLGFKVRVLPTHIEELVEMAEVGHLPPVPTPLGDVEIEDDTHLDADGHKLYRAIVGKLQWLAPERLDIRNPPKERGSQAPRANEGGHEPGGEDPPPPARYCRPGAPTGVRQKPGPEHCRVFGFRMGQGGLEAQHEQWDCDVGRLLGSELLAYSGHSCHDVHHS